MKKILILLTVVFNFPLLLNAQVSAICEFQRDLSHSDSAVVSEISNVEFARSYSSNDTIRYIRLPKYTPKCRRSYLGFTVGALIPTRASANNKNVRANISCINFDLGNISYLFTPHFGLTAMFHIGFNSHVPSDSIESWTMLNYLGAKMGAFYSQPLSEKMHLDFRMMGGYFLAYLKNGEVNNVALLFNMSNWRIADGFSLSGGVVLRYNLSRRSALMANVDYFISTPSFKDPDRYSIPVRAFTAGVGVAFRIP